MAQDRQRIGPYVRLQEVPIRGYRLETDLTRYRGSFANDGPMLVGPHPLNRAAQFRRYDPTRVPKLHRVFARLGTTDEAICAAASKLGLLVEPRLPLTSEPLINPNVARLETGEPVSAWRSQIYRVAGLLGLWELLRARDLVALGKIVHWERDPLCVSLSLPLSRRDRRLVPDWAVLAQRIGRGAEEARASIRRAVAEAHPLPFQMPVETLPVLRAAHEIRQRVERDRKERNKPPLLSEADREILQQAEEVEFRAVGRVSDRITSAADRQILLRVERCSSSSIATGHSPAGFELLRRWRFGDPEAPARHHLSREVSEQLEKHVRPALTPGPTQQLIWMPDGLLGAVYLHLALEITGQTLAPFACALPDCLNTVTPARRNQQYCSPRCRKLAWARRESADRSAE